MSSVINIPKANDDHDNYPCWIPTVNSKKEYIKPSIRCKCGLYCGIGLHHVHEDGTVTASFFHMETPEQPESHKGCGWHVFIKLEDYSLGEFKPQK